MDLFDFNVLEQVADQWTAVAKAKGFGRIKFQGWLKEQGLTINFDVMPSVQLAGVLADFMRGRTGVQGLKVKEQAKQKTDLMECDDHHHSHRMAYRDIRDHKIPELSVLTEKMTSKCRHTLWMHMS